MQLVRPTFTLVTVPSSRGGTRTEFGDLPLFDIAVLPWPDRKKTGLLIGIGPTFVFPTATSKSAGQGAWQAGPALGAIYYGIPGLLVGFIAQNPISFAYTSPNRPPQNTFEFQPVLALHLWDKWYLRSAEANWTMGWHRHSPTMLPLSLGLGRTLVRPGLPPMSLFVTGQWMVYRQFAPVAPQTTINFGLTVAFPQLEYYWVGRIHRSLADASIRFLLRWLSDFICCCSLLATLELQRIPAALKSSYGGHRHRARYPHYCLDSSCCDAGRALISASFPKAAMRWMALVRCPPI